MPWKKLKWKFWGLPHDYGRGVWDANGVDGTYTIMDTDAYEHKNWDDEQRFYVRKTSKSFPTVEAAQQDCQEDNNHRLEVWLESDPV